MDAGYCLLKGLKNVCGEFSLAFLAYNFKRVINILGVKMLIECMTYEMIMELVWNEQCDYYSRKAINNHISNLRKKLKLTPDMPDYSGLCASRTALQQTRSSSQGSRPFSCP